MNNTRILIVDDDEDDRFMLQQAFEAVNNNLKLEIKSSGEDAIAYLQTVPEEHVPCLIVLDYNMPIFNGKDMLQHICKIEKVAAVPKVVLSTSNSPYLVEDCLSNGAIAFKVKPNIFKELVVVANELLEICNRSS
jgi:CheY-like chemotaxis protein